MARLILPDGTETKVFPENGLGARGKWTLPELQAQVGGLIQMVPGTRARAWCNEEGLILGMAFNERASREFRMRLVGPVLVMERGEKC